MHAGIRVQRPRGPKSSLPEMARPGHFTVDSTDASCRLDEPSRLLFGVAP